jgi:hypothetical protein
LTLFCVFVKFNPLGHRSNWHFATSGSLEREARLLAYRTPREDAERLLQAAEGDTIVTSLMARTRRDVFTTTPEVPFDSSEVEEIVQEIDRSGLLDAEIAQYLHGIRIDSCEHLSELQRTALLQRLYAPAGKRVHRVVSEVSELRHLIRFQRRPALKAYEMAKLAHLADHAMHALACRRVKALKQRSALEFG